MSWIIGFALAAFATYFMYFRKQKSSEVVIRSDSSVTQSAAESKFIDVEGEDSDNWEQFDFYNATMLPATGRYRIAYEDQRGLKTERDIRVKRVHERGGSYAIDAHCELRNAHRSFLGDRIESAVNLDSGEIVGNVASDAISQYADSGAGRALSAIEKEWMGVSVLIFVCKQDGQMRKSERFIIAEYLKKYCSSTQLDDTELDSAIKALGEPDQKEFKRIVRDLKDAGDKVRLTDLLNYAKRIVDTQKTIDPMEKAALEILEIAAS